jgi:hypothetical protein
MLAVVATAVIAVELAYQRYPLPPGVDPGDWIQRSYAWVGLPAVTPDAVGSPYLYPPVMFPILGTTVRVAGSPEMAGFVFGGLLITLYGLSCIHLARRYLRTGPGQLLVVGLAVWNGTTLQMLFWGGYPNLLALAFANEALVFFLAFVRTRSTVTGVAFWGIASVVYLTHSLTFVLLGVTVVGAGILWTIEDRSFWRILRTRGSLIGIPVLLATVAIYSSTIRSLGIETPGYFGSNPAAYVLDGIGRYFQPLAAGPLYLPPGPVVLLAPELVTALLLTSALVVFGATIWMGRQTYWRDPRYTILGAMLSGTLSVPAVGWLAHVDTDYTRFVYFLPLPFALLIGFLFEEGVRRMDPVPGVDGERPTPTLTSDRSVRAWLRRPETRRAAVAPAVGAVLILLFAGVAAPTISQAEQANAGTSHDAAFLQALHFLRSNPVPGSVLTLQSSVRWVEAISSRGSFDVGPTWLLFEPWQITNAEESYWAFNTRFALTNNVEALGFSSGYTGVDSSPISSAPMYAVYLNGVAVPILNVQTAGLSVNVTSAGHTAIYPAGQWGAPTFALAPDGSPAATLSFRGPLFNVTEASTVRPSGGAGITFTVTPSPGVVINQVLVGISAPSFLVALLHAPVSQGVLFQNGALTWSVGAIVGSQLTTSTVTTRVEFAPPPIQVSTSPPALSNAATAVFANPSGAAWTGGMNLTTNGTWNPAIHLSSVLDTAQFLAKHQIHFLLLPTRGAYAYTNVLYQLLFGWKAVFANAEWTVFSG